MPCRSFARWFCGAMLVVLTSLSATSHAKPEGEDLVFTRRAGGKPRNVIFILTDDHRYDAMGFVGHPFLKTPNMDALARDGAYLKNAFVTTSLCSPSRASILTGRYVHNHKVIDNNNLAPEGTIFFPQYLQKVGYQTAFVGKWHMGGDSDAPRPGFDRWVSFRGQGRYFPPDNKNSSWGFNVDGEHVPQKGYITDELTDYAVDWLDKRDKDRPFFLYLSHKAVHAGFDPAPRHRDLYKDVKIEPPATQANTPENNRGKPLWVQNQRNSWHGVEYPYHSTLDVREYYRRYCQAIAGVDDSIGRVMQWLREQKLDQETLVIYMGDNGFLFGEHGLIDKRNAYEESMRVPMLLHCPELVKGGTVVEGIVANIDVGPSVLAAAGVETPEQMDGRDFLGLVAGKTPLDQWRQYLLYEYYWEYNYPQTPTMFALRGNDFKYIQYQGLWDTDELYDMQNDIEERHNLIRDPQHNKTRQQMRQRLFEELRATGGLSMPLGEKKGHSSDLRSAEGSRAADFPDYLYRDKESK